MINLLQQVQCQTPSGESNLKLMTQVLLLACIESGRRRQRSYRLGLRVLDLTND